MSSKTVSGDARLLSEEVKRVAHVVRDNVGTHPFLILWLVPSSVFIFFCLLYTFAFLAVPSVCILASLLFGLGSLILLLARKRGPLFLPLAMASALAIGSGTFFGLYVFDQFSIFPSFYANSRLYTNVVPSQPSAAVADAGKLVFTRESFVDTQRSVSYVTERGYTYCAAPVRDSSNAKQIEFWAVGIGCCSDGEFYCDASGERRARAGIAVFDNIGFFAASRRDNYEKARRKAESAYAIASSKDPMYIRWVREDNLDMLSRQYAAKAAIFLTVVCFAHVLLFLVLTALLHRPKYLRQYG